jgi:hypothetical protein
VSSCRFLGAEVFQKLHHLQVPVLHGPVQGLGVHLQGLHRFAPARRARLPVQPEAAVVQHQGLDVVGVAVDVLVGGRAPQGGHGLGHGVDEAPDELGEVGPLALLGQLVGDAGGHLGHPRETAHRVVAGGEFRVAQMEEVELVRPAGTPGLGVHALQQIGIALGVEHDHHIATTDVLGDEQLRQSGLAHAGGAQHQHVAHPLAQVHPHRVLVRLHAVDGRVTPDRWQGGDRVPPGLGTGEPAQPVQRRALHPPFQPPGRPVQPARPQQRPIGRIAGVVQPLGMAPVPGEAHAQEQSRSDQGMASAARR